MTTTEEKVSYNLFWNNHIGRFALNTDVPKSILLVELTTGRFCSIKPLSRPKQRVGVAPFYCPINTCVCVCLRGSEFSKDRMHIACHITHQGAFQQIKCGSFFVPGIQDSAKRMTLAAWWLSLVPGTIKTVLTSVINWWDNSAIKR